VVSQNKTKHKNKEMPVIALVWHSLPSIKIMPNVKTMYIWISGQQLNHSSDVHEIQWMSSLQKVIEQT